MARRISIGLAIVAPALIIVVASLNWWQPVGLKRLVRTRDLKLLLPPAVYVSAFWICSTTLGKADAGTTFNVLGNTLLVGISEELMFRGILFYGAASAFGNSKAVWVTAVIFGLVHITNGIVTGDFGVASIQAINAFMVGSWLAALRLNLGAIIPLMVIHWLWDAGPVLLGSQISQPSIPTPSGAILILQALIVLTLQLPLFLYGLWLLQRYRRQSAQASD